MSTTVNNLIISALRKINVVQANETPSPSDMQVTLAAFDQMIDSWSNDRLMVYTVQPYIFNVTPGQGVYQLGPVQQITSFGNIVGGSGYTNGTYTNVPITTVTGNGKSAYGTVTVSGGAVTAITPSTFNSVVGDDTPPAGYGYLVGDTVTVSNTQIGGTGTGFTAKVATNSGGDWAIIRPLRIEEAYVIWNDPTSAQAVDLGIAMLNDAQYASIAVKNTPSSFEFAMYDDGAYPIRNISMWPVPNAPSKIRLWLRQPLVDFTNLNQVVSYPPGYERAFIYNLACEVAPEFGKVLTQDVMAVAAQSRKEIQSQNTQPQYQTGDGGLSASRRSFNWITGGLIPWTRF